MDPGAGHTHDELVVDVPTLGRGRGQTEKVVLDQPAFHEKLSVMVGVCLAAGGPSVQMRQLGRDHRSLEGIKAEVAADQLVVVLRLGPVGSEDAELVGPLQILCNDHPAIPCAPQILRGEETQAAVMAHRPGTAARVLRRRLLGPHPR